MIAFQQASPSRQYAICHSLYYIRVMSALPQKADIAESDWHVRFALLCRARSPAVKREAEEDLSR
jgi:hypothetical protein